MRHKVFCENNTSLLFLCTSCSTEIITDCRIMLENLAFYLQGKYAQTSGHAKMLEFSPKVELSNYLYTVLFTSLHKDRKQWF